MCKSLIGLIYMLLFQIFFLRFIFLFCTRQWWNAELQSNNLTQIMLQTRHLRIYKRKLIWCARLESHLPGTSGCNMKYVILKLNWAMGNFSTCCRTPPWIPQELCNDMSTLVQVMGFCCQTTRHYLNQCWLSSRTPYGVTRGHCDKAWINSTAPVAPFTNTD